MRKLVDLTAPMRPDHFRWPLEQTRARRFEDGEDFQVTKVGFAVHGFTHIDAPRHMLQEGSTTTEMAITDLVQPMGVLDLHGISDNQEITDGMLKAAATHVRTGDSFLVRTEWDSRYSLDSPNHWDNAPFMSRAAAELLMSWKPKLVAFDFPQDYCIRKLVAGVRPAIEEFVTHDVLLRNGIYLVEYVANTAELTSPRFEGWVLPLKLLDADGAPVRMVAVEEE